MFNPETQEKKEKYQEEKEINGIKIIVVYDTRYGNYVLKFPQIELGEEAIDKGVFDQIIRIDENPDNAKKIFDLAVKEAENGSDVYKLFKKSEAFAGELE